MVIDIDQPQNQRYNRNIKHAPEGPLLQGVCSGPHRADALVDVHVGRTGNLHGLAQLHRKLLGHVTTKVQCDITLAFTCLMPWVPSRLI